MGETDNDEEEDEVPPLIPESTADAASSSSTSASSVVVADIPPGGGSTANRSADGEIVVPVATGEKLLGVENAWVLTTIMAVTRSMPILWAEHGVVMVMIEREDNVHVPPRSEVPLLCLLSPLL